jgi:TubC N-terminal docking domain
MSAAQLLADLAQRGIRLEGDGERLRYYPRSAVRPEVLERLKAHKGELLQLLRPTLGFDVDSAPDAEPAPISEKQTHRMPQELRRRVEATPDTWQNIDPTTTKQICRCGSTTWRDVPIHDGQSSRRDCGKCGRFIEFSIWYGNGTGHNGQHTIR